MSVAPLAERYLDAIRSGNLGLSARLEDELDAETLAADARLSGPRALASAALWYAKQGVAVFPCTPREKTPLAKVGGQWIAPNGLKDATTDVDKVRRWWQAAPDANIGAPTGRLFDVIDVDGREGVLAVYTGDAPLIDSVVEIAHAVTPRQAGHHVFIAPQGHGNRANMLPKVDYRGAGGYVLLAPSVGANGARYAWTRPLKLGPRP